MDKTVVIKNDVYDIAARIKEIDKEYYVIYNISLKRFEVHNIRNKPSSLAVVLPYDNLDARAVRYVMKTRIHRINQIAAEIELNNLRLEQAKERKVIDETGYKVKHLSNYILRGKDYLPSSNEI